MAAVICASDITADLVGEIQAIQKELFAIGSRLADPRSRVAERVSKAFITPADVERLEKLIDRLQADAPPSGGLPLS